VSKLIEKQMVVTTMFYQCEKCDYTSASRDVVDEHERVAHAEIVWEEGLVYLPASVAPPEGRGRSCWITVQDPLGYGSFRIPFKGEGWYASIPSDHCDYDFVPAELALDEKLAQFREIVEEIRTIRRVLNG